MGADLAVALPMPRSAASRRTIQRSRFGGIAERKLRRRQLTEDGNVEDQRAGLTLSCRWETVPPAGGASQIDPGCVKTRKLSENGASEANFFAPPSL